LAEVKEQPSPRENIKTPALPEIGQSDKVWRQSQVYAFYRHVVKMVFSTNRSVFLSLLAAILPILYVNWYPLLNKYAGRIDFVDATHLHGHINQGPVNNNKCWTFPGMITLALELHELTIHRRQSMRGCENTS
jgi:hypothetical protein